MRGGGHVREIPDARRGTLPKCWLHSEQAILNSGAEGSPSAKDGLGPFHGIGKKRPV